MPVCADGALGGRRVLELAGDQSAYCGKLFADLGADVIRVEPPGGDPARRIPPFVPVATAPPQSLPFLYANTNKRSVTLDLRRPEAAALVLALASRADIVVETTKPGTLEALGLGFERLRAGNPRLVLTSITGFGQTGPQRGWRSSDLVASALGGALAVTGEEEDPPVRLAGAQAHVAASCVAAAGSLVALLAASVRGEGQRVDVSVEEVVASVTHICGIGKWLDDGIVPRRRGSSLFHAVPSGAYPCRDGLVYLIVNRPLHWQALARWVNETTGNAEILDPMFEGPSSNRLPHRELLDLFLVEFSSRLSVDFAYREGQRRHIAVTPLHSAADVARDPHLEARGFFADVDHPVAGRLRHPGAPYQLDGTPCRIRRPAPAPGEHNPEVYRDELGIDEHALAEFAAGGVI
jgi:crotonobetainyl-CoA:carnitine CoA-transferase CaiB-like acyl-CoA transferase